MVRKVLEACPSCGSAVEIREVGCTRCDTQVRAHYRPCDFCALTEEQSNFLRVFVTSRGNLSDVEKRLGVSYPTVRAKLDEVIDRLGAGVEAPVARPRASRRTILEAIARGELTPAEGAAQIKQMGEDQ